MSQQVKGSRIPTDEAPRFKRASGSDLQKLVMSFRRRGAIASFGVDKDPKLSHKG